MFKKIIILLILVAVAVVGFKWFRGNPVGTEDTSKVENSTTSASTDTGSYTKSGGASDVNTSDKNSSSTQNSREYKSSEHKFSFRYPEGYTVRVMPASESEGTLETITVEKNGQGLQVVISPFEEPASSLTEEQIRADVPDLEISNSQKITVGSEGKQGMGLMFKSNNPSFSGDSFDSWFVYNKELYQISAFSVSEALVKSTTANWIFF